MTLFARWASKRTSTEGPMAVGMRRPSLYVMILVDEQTLTLAGGSSAKEESQ